MKIVINRCFGGFCLSEKAIEFLKENGIVMPYYSDMARDNELLVKAVEKFGHEAGGSCSKLEIVEIPFGVDWEISEYDGFEKVAEKHRTWP